MKTHEQVRKEFRQATEESIASIRAIKGDNYADAVQYFHQQLHGARIMKILLHKLIEQEPQALVLVQSALTSYAQMMHNGARLVADGFSFSDETLKEMLDWAITLDSRLDKALKELGHE